MREKLCPVDDLVKIDLEGYEEAGLDPTCETTTYDLNGKEVS